MISTGEQLKQARLGKGLSLRDITTATKIQTWVVDALERNELHTTMSPIYVKSFIKTYAGFVELNAAGLITQLYPPAAPAVEPYLTPLGSAQHARQEIATLSPQAPGRRTASDGTPVADPAFGGVPGSVAPTRNRPPRAAAWAAGLARVGSKTADLLADALAHVMEWAPAFSRRAAPVLAAVVVLAVIVVTKPHQWVSMKAIHKQASFSVPAPRQPSTLDMPLELTPSTPLELSVRVRRTTWISVKADGKLLAQRQLKGGAKESWTAQKRFDVIIANPAHVELVLNGQTITQQALANQGRLAITHSRIKPLAAAE